VLHPLGDTFWGDRHGQITDPFGHRWGLAQHMRNVPSEEMIRAAAEALSASLYPGTGSEEPQSGHPRTFSREICVAKTLCWSECLALLSKASI
jgi:hypothetical protein